MEDFKVKGEAKSITTSYGAELTYCERCKEHDEVVVFPGFFFYTFMDIVKAIAERYHVYGLIMRFDGPADEFNEDGSVNWAKQRGKDEYEFCQLMGIERFIHVGKFEGYPACICEPIGRGGRARTRALRSTRRRYETSPSPRTPSSPMRS